MARFPTDSIRSFLYRQENAFYAKYYKNLGRRFHTMKTALNLFYQRGGDIIVETGCQREPDDWGAGMSTTVFAETTSLYGGRLYTVDNTQKHLDIAKELTKQYTNVDYTLMDSVKYLEDFRCPIDLLYLDSYDYPIEKLPGSFDCTLSDEVVIKDHLDIIGECQEHCKLELRAALPVIHKNTIILIDDNNLPGGGKSRLAREWLFDNGWTNLIDDKQTLWIKD